MRRYRILRTWSVVLSVLAVVSLVSATVGIFAGLREKGSRSRALGVRKAQPAAGVSRRSRAGRPPIALKARSAWSAQVTA